MQWTWWWWWLSWWLFFLVLICLSVRSVCVSVRICLWWLLWWLFFPVLPPWHQSWELEVEEPAGKGLPCDLSTFNWISRTFRMYLKYSRICKHNLCLGFFNIFCDSPFDNAVLVNFVIRQSSRVSFYTFENLQTVCRCHKAPIQVWTVLCNHVST